MKDTNDTNGTNNMNADPSAAPWNYGADPRVIDLKESVQAEWFERPGVRAVSVSRGDDGDLISVLIDKGTDAASLGLPAMVQDVPVKVRAVTLNPSDRTQTAEPEPATGVPDTAFYNPLVGGIEIGTSHKIDGQVVTGTLGVVVQEGDERPVMLSNYHVLYSEGKGSPDDDIYQPGTGETKTAIGHPGDYIYDNFTMHYRDRTREVGVDAAICRAQTGQRPGTLREITEAGRIADWAEPRLHTIVKKRGAFTRATNGYLIDVAAAVRNENKMVMENQFLVNSASPAHFAEKGDSGAVVYEVREDKLTAVGLLWGVVREDDGSISAVCSPFTAVVEALTLR